MTRHENQTKHNRTEQHSKLPLSISAVDPEARTEPRALPPDSPASLTGPGGRSQRDYLPL
jgi:hypothetical protein